MRASRFAVLVVLPLFLVLCSTGAWAGERGYFGFGLSVTTRGFFLNPEVTALKIASVVHGMPAERAGVRAGDTITKVDGLAVAGSKASQLKSHAERDVGQSLRLELRHADGQVYAVSLVAVARP